MLLDNNKNCNNCCGPSSSDYNYKASSSSVEYTPCVVPVRRRVMRKKKKKKNDFLCGNSSTIGARPEEVGEDL